MKKKRTAYHKHKSRPTTVVEIMIPWIYRKEALRFLDDASDPKKIRSIASVKKYYKGDLDKFAETSAKMFCGHSIYEVEGSYQGKPEKTLVIRIINKDSQISLKTSLSIVRQVITARFALEIGAEEQIWTIAFNALLSIYVNKNLHDQ